MAPFIGETGKETKTNEKGDLFWCKVDWQDPKTKTVLSHLTESLSRNLSIGDFNERLAPGTSVQIAHNEGKSGFDVKVEFDERAGAEKRTAFLLHYNGLTEDVARTIYSFCGLNVDTISTISRVPKFTLLVEDIQRPPYVGQDKFFPIAGVLFSRRIGENNYRGFTYGTSIKPPHINTSRDHLTIIACQQNPNPSMFQ